LRAGKRRPAVSTCVVVYQVRNYSWTVWNSHLSNKKDSKNMQLYPWPCFLLSDTHSWRQNCWWHGRETTNQHPEQQRRTLEQEPKW
jgi:hypothetical protein